MAIKLPDPGNGIPEQKTGNDEWTNMQIVRDNFADQSNAASRLVGIGNDLIPTGRDAFSAAFSSIDISYLQSSDTVDFNTLPVGKRIFVIYTATMTNGPQGYGNTSWVVETSALHSAIVGAGAVGGSQQIAYAYGKNIVLRRTTTRPISEKLGWTTWSPISVDPNAYTKLNTTKEEGTGYLVASSPVLKVQHDSFEKEHEAEQLDIEVKNIKTGVYEITGTTGLREGDGWNLKPPKDVNGNVLCICEATESNGVITLKTYAKRFDFETVSIVADYDKPLDIPEGATVMLRFNDLPEEQLDEPIE